MLSKKLESLNKKRDSIINKIEGLQKELDRVNDEIAKEKTQLVSKEIENLNISFDEFWEQIQSIKKN